MTFLTDLFSLDGKVAVVTGGTGVLGGAMARGLAQAGAKVGILGRRAELAEAVAQRICQEGGEAVALPADVLDSEQLKTARTTLLERWGHIDILVNAAGGNFAPANVLPEGSFFTISPEAMQQVMALNWMGTLLPTQIFGEPMATQPVRSEQDVSAELRAIDRALQAAYDRGASDAEIAPMWVARNLLLADSTPRLAKPKTNRT